MELSLLGPLELAREGVVFGLGGPRQRTVLAVLALHANRVTPREQLVDAVWGEAPPETARTQVQSAVSALRKAFARAGRPDAITTLASGYRLALADGELDLRRFERLVAEARGHAAAGRPERATTVFRSALALWRGPALLGLEGELVRQGATLLDEQRLSVVEELARLDLSLGRHAEITGELLALTAQEPLREGLHASLILALHRSGRTAEALDAFRRTRAVFVRELGIEPGRELQELETAILRADPALDLRRPAAPGGTTHGGSGSADAPYAAADSPLSGVTATHSVAAVPAGPSARPEQLPSDLPDFTGRAEFLAEISEFLSGGGDGAFRPGEAVRIAGISGQDGIGKTSLAIHAAHALRDAFPDGRLFANLGGESGREVTAGVLARFLRALGVPGHAIPEDADERRTLYRSLLAGRRVLIVLDEVGDEAVARELLPGDAHCGVLVTGRYRLTGLPGIRQINLDLFDPELSVELLTRIAGVERVTGQLPAALELAQFCGGLPLALRVVGARLACRPHWPLDRLVRRFRDEASRLDEFDYCGMEVRSHIALAYRALDPEPQRLFRLLALVEGGDFASWTAASLLDCDLVTADDIVEELVHSQLLDVLPREGRPPRYRFHELIRVYAKEELRATETPEQRRAALGRALASWTALAEEAHRREHGGPFGVPHGTAARRPLPGPLTDRLLDVPALWWEEEHEALVAAVRQAAELGLDDLCRDLAATCAIRFASQGRCEDWSDTAHAALTVSEAAGNRRGTAVSTYSLGALALFRYRLDEAARLLGAARDTFRELADAQGEGLAGNLLATVDRLGGRHPESLAGHAAAAALLRRAGDPVGEALALAGGAALHREADETGTARSMLTTALALTREAGSAAAEGHVVRELGELSLQTGETELAQQAFALALRVGRAGRDRTAEGHALLGTGTCHARAGRGEQAEAVLLQALTLARRTGDRLTEGRACLGLGRSALDAGAPTAALAHLTAARDVFAALAMPLWQGRAASALLDLHAATLDTPTALGEASAAARLLAGHGSPASARLREELLGKRLLLGAAD
ncbi:BTAD domain-containing putative transcriptional regulator [Streptomyces sp. NPDC059442]|uniref:AfsR/SARP family transcriptional regulator n=1 Tax=Streptomyces sp. NPDC059442 TaxID=3346830 RepID=UPI0036AF19B4